MLGSQLKGILKTAKAFVQGALRTIKRVAWDWEVLEPTITLRPTRHYSVLMNDEEARRFGLSTSNYDDEMAQRAAWDLYNQVYFQYKDKPPFMGPSKAIPEPCALGPTRLPGKKWIVATGCGHFRIPRDAVSEVQAEEKVKPLTEPFTLRTAGGEVPPDGTLGVHMPAFGGEIVETLVMEDSPYVMPAGERCTEHGY